MNHAFTFSVPSLLNFLSLIKDDIIKVDKQWVPPFNAISALSWEASIILDPGHAEHLYTEGVDCIQENRFGFGCWKAPRALFASRVLKRRWCGGAVALGLFPNGVRYIVDGSPVAWLGQVGNPNSTTIA